MGVNQSHQGVKTAQAAINLALMTGNIGRPGTGANSITGQCNAMGSRLFSNTTNLLGGRDFTNPADRAEVAALLGIPERTHPGRGRAGRTTEILDGMRSGDDPRPLGRRHQPGPLLDRPGRVSARPSAKLDFLVVQDMYHSTETAAAGRPAAAGGGVGREGGDVHQLGAPGRA